MQADTFTGVSGMSLARATRQRLRLELDCVPLRSELLFQRSPRSTSYLSLQLPP